MTTSRLNKIQVHVYSLLALVPGHSDAITWLGECLKRTAEDRDDDDTMTSEATPIVPLTEAQESAMESTVFKALLRRCGVKPPADEQEQFWRISAKLSAIELQCRARALEPVSDVRGGDAASSGDVTRKTSKLEELRRMVREKKKVEKEVGRKSIYKRCACVSFVIITSYFSSLRKALKKTR